MPLEALIWDVDGTLAETEEGHRAAFNAAFADAGLPWHWDAALYARLLEVTGGKERIRHYLDTTPGTGTLDADAVRRLHAAKTAHYVAAVAAVSPRSVDAATATAAPVERRTCWPDIPPGL